MNAGSDPTTEQDPRPQVALPRPALPGALIAVAAAVAALILFIVLDAQRRTVSGRNSTFAPATGAFPSPPPLVVPPDPSPAAPVVLVTEATPRTFTFPTPPRAAPPSVAGQGAALPSFPSFTVTSPSSSPPSDPDLAVPGSGSSTNTSELGAPRAERRPALVIDGAAATVAPAAGGERQSVTGGAPPVGAGRGGPGTGGDDAPARASFIGDQTTVMPTGTVIPAVLETPIDTARPGLVRAIVSQDTRGFDGRRVLVPRGSRLIGEYQADVRSGQNRVLVTWNRLIRPDGATIRLASPTADSLGGAGVPGRVETFFWQRFASALLQSALTVGVNLASRPGNGSVIVGLPSGPINNVVGQALLPGSDLRPKIIVKQGAALTVFVARDLDFASVAGRP